MFEQNYAASHPNKCPTETLYSKHSLHRKKCLLHHLSRVTDPHTSQCGSGSRSEQFFIQIQMLGEHFFLLSKRCQNKYFINVMLYLDKLQNNHKKYFIFLKNPSFCSSSLDLTTGTGFNSAIFTSWIQSPIMQIRADPDPKNQC